MIPENLVGQSLGPYQIESILGSGGMATVYRATTPQGELVALKTLFPPPGVGPEMLARFEREARTVAKLRHPAIVSVLDVGHAAGRSYMVMAFVAGQTLADYLLHRKRLDESTAADLAWQIADALHYAHSRNIIHRDIKPSNIMLTTDQRVMLTDFGVALALDDPALTRTGFIVGTPAYLAPEQATGQRPDGRADLYALGVVLYQMVTGQLPFRGTTPKVLHAHVYDTPSLPSTRIAVSAELEAVIMRALAKQPADRFQTGLEMAQALATLGPQPPTHSQHPIPLLSPAGSPPEPSYTTPNLPRSTSANPFFYGGAVAPALFYGRRDLLQSIVQRVRAAVPQSVSIVGERRMGKSSLLAYFQAYATQHFPDDVLIISLDLMKAYSRTRPGLMKALRRALTRLWREPWSPAEDGDLMAFDFAVEELLAEGWQLLLCLDEVENLTERATEFNDVLEDWRACAQLGQIAIIAASAQPLADLCVAGGLTSPFYNIFSQHRLGLLAPEEWQSLVSDHLPATPADLAFIERVAGGQPFFTQMAASHLWEAHQSGPVDHERLYSELWFQLKPHLNHLWRSLTSVEQTTLRRLMAGEEPTPAPRLVAALERRGLVRAGQPFSQLFSEMIATELVD